MAYLLLDTTDTVQVLGPHLVVEGLLCSIQSFPSGSRLVRTVPLVDFQADHGQALLSSLSDAVEQELGAGVATAAEGFQALDSSQLLYDAVTFTVTYAPPNSTGGTIEAPVTIPVNALTADTQFSGFLAGGSAAERIDATYQKLQAMASG